MIGADLRLLFALPLLGALAVAVAPAAWSRRLGAAAGGLALVVTGLVAMVEPASAAVRLEWVPALGLTCSLGVDGLTIVGLLVTAWVGGVAALAPGGSRGSISGGLALQAVVSAILMARDLGLLLGCYGLLAPLVAALVHGGPRSDRLPAALAVGAYLSLGTALLAVAAGGLAVAHHDASGGQWSLELAALAEVLLPAGAELAVGLALALAAALTLGLWPLHGWLLAGLAAARPGTALLLAGPLRWLGLDLLVRLWLGLTPSAAAAQAPVFAWVAVLGAIYGAVVARAEPESRRAVGLAALVPAGLLTLGVAGQHHEGLLGAVMLALALGLGGAAALLAESEAAGHVGPRATLGRRLAPLGLLPAPGLVGLAGVALVMIGTARFAGLTLGAHALGLALAAGLAVLLGVRSLTSRTCPVEHGASDMSLGGLLRPAMLLAPVVAAGVWPGRVLGEVEVAAQASVEAAARRRCVGLVLAIEAPERASELAGAVEEACAQPLRALERLQEEAR